MNAAGSWTKGRRYSSSVAELRIAPAWAGIMGGVQLDIDIRLGDHRFNFRVGAVIRRDRAVLTCSLPGSTFCFLPGGRVRAGEATQAALERELHEELGVRASVGSLAMIVENFFPYGEHRYHELGLYYVVELPDGIDPSTVTDVENGATFRWIEIEDLAAADLRPSFLCEALSGDLGTTQHFVHVE
jgi:8-oxo-dGTP pyrophosphatase MutT (NUDIX family)